MIQSKKNHTSIKSFYIQKPASMNNSKLLIEAGVEHDYCVTQKSLE